MIPRRHPSRGTRRRPASRRPANLAIVPLRCRGNLRHHPMDVTARHPTELLARESGLWIRDQRGAPIFARRRARPDVVCSIPGRRRRGRRCALDCRNCHCGSFAGGFRRRMDCPVNFPARFRVEPSGADPAARPLAAGYPVIYRTGCASAPLLPWQFPELDPLPTPVSTPSFVAADCNGNAAAEARQQDSGHAELSIDEIVEKHVASGYAEGWERGLAEGREKGYAEGIDSGTKMAEQALAAQ